MWLGGVWAEDFSSRCPDSEKKVGRLKEKTPAPTEVKTSATNKRKFTDALTLSQAFRL